MGWLTKRRRLRAGSLSMAERSYPTSEVRGSGLECQAAMVQERPRGATQRPRPVAARRRHPKSEIRGGDLEEPPGARGQGRQLGVATHTRGQGRRPGGATRGVVAAQAQEGLGELSHVEGQERRQ